MSNLNCSQFGVCGGCPWGGRPLADQQMQKLAELQDIHPQVGFTYTPVDQVRDKADLVWQNVDGKMRLGLYGLSNRDVIDLEACPMMTPALDSFYRKFREQAPPINKGSVRLRVSPDGDWGVWLDFANEDVKTLFEEKNYLRFLSEMAFVEIGQRRKALYWKDGQPKLIDPVLKPWFQTYDAKFDPIPLYGPVGGFSQTGFKANEALIQALHKAVNQVGIQAWVDLFSGNGNFTLAMASRGYAVEAVELDPLAVEGLQMSLDQCIFDWKHKVSIKKGDIYLKSEELPSFKGKGLIVDPPRAGLRQLLEVMQIGAMPEAIAYVSCHTESFIKDAERLKLMGFKLQSLQGVDQFPQSPHCEWVGLFTL